MIARVATLAVAWLALTAAAPLPLTPPPPDLTALVPFVAAPLDKPTTTAPPLPLPPAPAEVPPVRPAVITLPGVEKPTAPLVAPGTAPCFWAWLPSASEQLKCGLARFHRGEHEKAREVLEQAVRGASDRELIAEARYWLAETHYALGRPDQADPLFRQVAQETRHSLAVWALSGSGWTALRAGDSARARDVFARLAAAPGPAVLDTWSRHGLGLALYALGRYEEAERAWAGVHAHALSSAFGRDVTFWQGETLGRLGRYADAQATLKRFTSGGAHPLLETGLLRQGWWGVAAGRAAESVAPLRTVIGMPVRPTAGNTAVERDWADAGLALALLGTGDVEGARRAAEPLRTRRSPLYMPVMLKLASGAIEAKRPGDIAPIVQELLGGQLDPPARAWVLLVAGDAARASDNRDEARTQYDLARQTDPTGPVGWQGALRVARTNFELREFAQAALDVAPLLSRPLPPEVRHATLLLRGEAAYHAGDFTTAADAFRRALVEAPQPSEAAGVRVALGWTALRQGRSDEARRHFVDFAKAHPEHALAGDALLLASELALASGDLDEARALLERVFTTYAANPRIEFAKLNRGLLLLRRGQPDTAQPMLREWIARAPFPELVGRAQAALGAALLATGRPADAAAAFAAASRAGEGGLATLGTAAVALAAGRLDEAKKTFTDARDQGPAAVTIAAEYGLAAIAYATGGDPAAFGPVARSELATAGPATAPALLYVLTGMAVAEKNWNAALESAKRIVRTYPTHDTADDALERIGSAAVRERAWPVAGESYALLLLRYPKSPFAEAATIALAEAQLNTGRAAESVASLERFVAANPTHAQAGRAWLALGRARESAGERPAALEAYAAAMRESANADVRRDAAVAQARVLMADKKWPEARTVLRVLIAERDTAVVAEAAQAIGDTFRHEGDALAATEYFMTAAYTAPESPAGRKALLAAAQTFAAAKQPEAAAIVYRKLLAQANLPSDLADAARQGLAQLPAR